MPTKDVGHCEKLRGAVYRRRSGDVRMGKPTGANLQYPDFEHIEIREGTWGTETSKYPEERKVFPQSWRANGEQPKPGQKWLGVVGPDRME